MPHYTDRESRRASIATTDPDGREALIAEVRDYIHTANLTQPQFAQYIGYGTSTFNKFLHGTYHDVARDDRRIRAAIRTFLDGNRIEPEQANLGRLYETENVAVIRQWFQHCLALGKRRGRMACIYAGPGSQKTFAVDHLIAEFNREHLSAKPRPRALYVYCSQDERPLSLVSKILRAAGIAGAALIQRSLTALRFHLRGTRTVIVLDEAQHLSTQCLEIVRELNDLTPFFGVLMLGSHRLREFFNANAAQLEQWHSRLTATVELPGLAPETIAGILRSELGDIVDFTTAQGETKLTKLVARCLVEDIYSREKATYYSIRTAFNTIEQIREQAAQKGATIQ